METVLIFFALAVTAWTAYMIIKGYKAQAILIFSGLILMTSAMIFIPYGDVASGGYLTAARRTGSRWFDLFAYIRQLLEVRTAAIGILIMSIAGFAKYMDHIGASRVLVFLAIKPLQGLKSPYIALSLCFVVGVLLNLVIASAAGLAMLLMVTMYPILLRLGVSKLGAAAVIGSCTLLDLGPASGTANLAAQTVGLDIMDYFLNHQVQVAIFIVITAAILHFFIQRAFDRKDGHVAEGTLGPAEEAVENQTDMPPKFYAILPVVPLALLIAFSTLFDNPWILHIVTAMLISLFVAMVCELIRTRDAKKVTGSIQVYFDGMGVSFATVITLIIAAEVFARGLMISGAVNGLIEGARSLGLGGGVFTIVMSSAIAATTVVMGSGVAAFFAFAGLVPDVAASIGVNPVSMILPMQLSTSIARSVSPIAAVIIAVAGIAGVSPVAVVKRTAIPLAGAMIANLAASLIFLS